MHFIVKKKTVDIIVNSKNNYFIQVKRNQKKLFTQIQKEFEKQIFLQHNNLNVAISKEKNKGRLEVRICHKINIKNTLNPQQFKQLGWNKLKSIVMIQTHVKSQNNQETFKKHYFISSQENTTENYYLNLKRKHWSVESYHYIKDVTYKEDASKIKANNHPQNNSLLRSTAISIYKSIGSTNQAQSIRRYSNDIPNLWKFINSFCRMG